MQAKMLVRAMGAATLTFSLALAGCGGGDDHRYDAGPVSPGSGTGGGTDPGTGSGSTTSQPAITTQPVNVNAPIGASVTFTVTATGGRLSYQWRRNGVPIAGATSSSYTTSVSRADDGAAFSVAIQNDKGDITSNDAILTLGLSGDQLAFEVLHLTPPGAYGFEWKLTEANLPVSGTHFIHSDQGVLATSPLLAGSQSVTLSAPFNPAATLAPMSATPTRVLRGGQILVVPSDQQKMAFTYVADGVRVDTFAADGTTIGLSSVRSGIVNVALSGALSNAPAELRNWHNVLWSNPALMDQTDTFPAGASYQKYTNKANGDRYLAFDCNGSSVTAAVVPCLTGTTLQAAMAGGMTSNADGKTYVQSDGTISTIEGIPVWVATAPRPQSSTLSYTVQYRVYFQLNGNVYTGTKIADGTVLGGSNWVANPAGATTVERLGFTDYQIRLNKQAHDAIAGALKF